MMDLTKFGSWTGALQSCLISPKSQVIAKNEQCVYEVYRANCARSKSVSIFSDERPDTRRQRHCMTGQLVPGRYPARQTSAPQKEKRDNFLASFWDIKSLLVYGDQ